MKTILYFAITIVITLVESLTAHSQTSVQWTRMLEMEGKWSGPTTLIAGGQIYHMNYKMNFKSSINNSVMTMDENFNEPTLGSFKGANLIGLNSIDGLIHWFSADNSGTAHEHIGSWTTATHFHMEHHSVQGGLPFIEEINVDLHSNGHDADISLIATLGPDVVEELTGTISRNGNGSNHRIANPGIVNDSFEANIYPNPSGKYVNVESKMTIDKIFVYNESGQLIQDSFPGTGNFVLQLEEKGIYFAKLISGKNEITRQVIIN